MKTYARVDAGTVMELLSTDDEIADMFNPALTWVDVSGLVPKPQQDWLYSDGVFTPPTS